MWKIALSLMMMTVSLNAQEAVLKENQLIEKEKGYSINLPENWRVQMNFMGLDLFASAPQKEGQKSLGTLSVISEAVPEEVALDRYFDENVKALQKTLKNFIILQSSDVDINGIVGKKIEYTHALNDLKIKVLQYYFVQNNRIFIITAAASDKEFDIFIAPFQKAIESFKLI